MKMCKDCKYFRVGDEDTTDFCQHDLIIASINWGACKDFVDRDDETAPSWIEIFEKRVAEGKKKNDI